MTNEEKLAAAEARIAELKKEAEEEPDEPTTEKPPVKPQKPQHGNWIGKVFDKVFTWIGSWWK